MSQWIKAKASTQLAIVLRSQVRHSNFDARTTPSPHTQLTASFVVIINCRIDFVNVSIALASRTFCNTKRKTRRSRGKFFHALSSNSYPTHFLTKKHIVFVPQFYQRRHGVCFLYLRSWLEVPTNHKPLHRPLWDSGLPFAAPRF